MIFNTSRILKSNATIKILSFLLLAIVVSFAVSLLLTRSDAARAKWLTPIDLNKEYAKEVKDSGYKISEYGRYLFEKNGFPTKQNFVFNDCIKVELLSNDDEIAFKQVFMDKHVNFNLPDNKKAIVIDVGADYGFTALYFASLSNVSRVFVFETFGSMVEISRKNVLLSEKLKEKIFIFPFGMSDKKEQNVEGEITRFFKASECIQAVVSEYCDKKEEKKILKIDCEGCENAIIPELDQSGALKHIDTIFLDLHGMPPKINKNLTNLKNIIKNNGFIIFEDGDNYTLKCQKM
ncbi:MAG: FkbM family methyltransferase [Oscillospiraceae bacterium]|jgi:FkbM family methyltransferase|nr:FkbM family methyltransferase [Oscillospiraceae bacterium]